MAPIRGYVGLYEKAHKIDARLKSFLVLITAGKYSASELARKLNISVATISRDVEALRQRGYEIKSVRDKKGWHYELSATGRQFELSLKSHDY